MAKTELRDWIGQVFNVSIYVNYVKMLKHIIFKQNRTDQNN